MDKIKRFPTYNVSDGMACVIFKNHLDNENVPMQSKIFAIEKVIELETHNGITKDELVRALRWLFKHYEFERE